MGYMENKKKLIYFINAVLNLIVSSAAIVLAASRIASADSKIGYIVIICLGSVFALLSAWGAYIVLKKEFLSHIWSDIVSVVLNVLAIGCFVWFVFDFGIASSVIFLVEFIASAVFQIIAMNYDDGRISYNHVKRTSRKSPTCTIQISTEYLVKDSYTPEEAEKTLEQLYSIHNNDGFSMEDYEKIKMKILNNTKETHD